MQEFNFDASPLINPSTFSSKASLGTNVWSLLLSNITTFKLDANFLNTSLSL